MSFFFFKQKTAYEMRISDWSSDVCSSDLLVPKGEPGGLCGETFDECVEDVFMRIDQRIGHADLSAVAEYAVRDARNGEVEFGVGQDDDRRLSAEFQRDARQIVGRGADRSEEHTSELQSLMRSS